MKRALHVLTDTNIGGAGRHVLTLLDATDSETFALSVVVPTGAAIIPHLQARGVPFYTAEGIADRSFSGQGVRALARVFKKISPDMVHTHGAFSGRVAARWCGIPCVATRHSVFPPSPTSMRFPLKQVLGAANHFFSQRIIAVSPAAKENLTQTGVRPNHIDVIYNGVPTPRVCSRSERKAIRARYGIAEDAFVVAHIARLTAVKGHEYTLDAAKLCAADAETVFLIAGDGPEEARLRRRVLDEGLDNVVFAGFVEAVEEIENIMDLQINASYGTEATSLSLLEGLGLGVPAVVSRFGGNPYVIRHEVNGLLVLQKDAAALAGGILRIKNDAALYASLSEGAAQEYADRFRDTIMSREITTLYQTVLAGSAKGENNGK